VAASLFVGGSIAACSMTQVGIPGTIQQGWVSSSVVVRAGVTSRVALPAECIFPGD